MGCCLGCCSTKKPSETEGLRQREAVEREEVIFAAMWCRSSKTWLLEQPMAQIGTRASKTFCRVRADTSSGAGDGDRSFRRLGALSWLLPGSRHVLAVSNLQRLVGLHEQHHLERVICVEHPLLEPVRHVDFPRPDRAVIVRAWRAGGSLRDVIHGARPDDDQTTKYDRVGTPLSEAKIARFGRALINVLLVLRPLGERVATHVHCGNLFLADGGYELRASEWEQGLLALPSHVAPFFADLKRSLEPAAVAFALCVYEMACGFELDGLPAVLPPTCPRSVREALEALMRPRPAHGAQPPCSTLEEALELPLFAYSTHGTAGGSHDGPPMLPAEILHAAAEVSKDVHPASGARR